MSHHEIERSLAEAGLNEAETALAAGDVAAALDALATAAEADPHNDEPPLLAAMLHLRRREYAAAASAALRAIEIRPFHPRAWNLAGTACLDAGQPVLACELLTRARRMAPALRGIRTALKQARRESRQTRGRDTRSSPVDGDALPIEAIRARLDADPASLTVAIDTLGADEQSIDDCRSAFGEITDDVILYESSDDRAAQRSELVRQSRRAWILFVDACEQLDHDASEPLLRALRSHDTPAWALPVCYDERTTRLELRLVRNAPGVSFDGEDRPSALDSLRALEIDFGGEIDTSEASLFSENPAPRSGTEAGAPANSERIKSLESAAFAAPDDVAARLELANALIAANRPEDALRHTRSARDTLQMERRRRRPLELEPLIVLEGLALMRLERPGDLESMLATYHVSFPSSASTSFLAGYAAKANDEPGRAVEHLEAAVELDGHATFSAPIAEVCGPGLFTMLGAARMDLHDTRGARDAFDDALSLEPDHVQARLGRIAVLRTDGELEAALLELDELVSAHGKNATVWLAGAVILESIDELAEPAVGWLATAHERLPDDARIQRRLGEALLRCGRGDEALGVWAGLSAGSTIPLGTRAAAALVSGAEMPVVPLEGDPQAAGQVLDWFERWARSGAIEALDRALVEIGRVERVLPGVGRQTAEWLEQIGQQQAAETLRGRL